MIQQIPVKGEKMQKENHRLMVEGNALYEIDLDCVRSKKEQEEKKKRPQGKNSVQRERHIH